MTTLVMVLACAASVDVTTTAVVRNAYEPLASIHMLAEAVIIKAAPPGGPITGTGTYEYWSDGWERYRAECQVEDGFRAAANAMNDAIYAWDGERWWNDIGSTLAFSKTNKRQLPLALHNPLLLPLAPYRLTEAQCATCVNHLGDIHNPDFWQFHAVNDDFSSEPLLVVPIVDGYNLQRADGTVHTRIVWDTLPPRRVAVREFDENGKEILSIDYTIKTLEPFRGNVFTLAPRPGEGVWDNDAMKMLDP